MNHFEMAVMALTAAIMESLPKSTDYLTVKGEVMQKLRVDAQEIREKFAEPLFTDTPEDRLSSKHACRLIKLASGKR